MSNMELGAMRVLLAAIVLFGRMHVCNSNKVEDSKEITSSCDVEFFDVFATVTCNFSVDVYVERRMFHLEYVSKDAPTKGPEIKIACIWTDGRVACTGEKGYELYNAEDFKVNLTDAKSGNYTCKIPDQSNAVQCYGRESSKVKTVDDASLAVALSLIIGSLVVILGAAIAVVLYCKKHRRQLETGNRIDNQSVTLTDQGTLNQNASPRESPEQPESTKQPLPLPSSQTPEKQVDQSKTVPDLPGKGDIGKGGDSTEKDGLTMSESEDDSNVASPLLQEQKDIGKDCESTDNQNYTFLAEINWVHLHVHV